VKKCISKIFTVVCLLIYVLFGFLNSGNIGFCIGDEHGSHFGLIIAGHETCCHNCEHITKNDNATVSCECNDIDIEPVHISQTSFNISNFVQIFEMMNLSQFIAYYVNYIDISHNQSIYYQKAPPDLLTANSNLIKQSVILLI
jgi:hypothetical protein